MSALRSPALAVEDAADLLMADAVLICEPSLFAAFTGRSRTDLIDLRCRQLRKIVRFASKPPMPLPTLGSHVSDVVGLSSQEQMSRVLTRRIVASMKNLHRAWVTVCKRPCKAVRLDESRCTARTVGAIPKQPMASCSDAGVRAAPWPAFVRTAHIDLRPVALFERFSHRCSFYRTSKVAFR